MPNNKPPKPIKPVLMKKLPPMDLHFPKDGARYIYSYNEPTYVCANGVHRVFAREGGAPFNIYPASIQFSLYWVRGWSDFDTQPSTRIALYQWLPHCLLLCRLAYNGKLFWWRRTPHGENDVLHALQIEAIHTDFWEDLDEAITQYRRSQLWAAKPKTVTSYFGLGLDYWA